MKYLNFPSIFPIVCVVPILSLGKLFPHVQAIPVCRSLDFPMACEWQNEATEHIDCR